MVGIYHPVTAAAAALGVVYSASRENHERGIRRVIDAQARAFVKKLGRTDLAEAAALFRRAFPDAMAEYARLGRSISKVLIEHAACNAPRAAVKARRNDPCPCGSGRKYKKRCGSAS